MRRIEKTLRPLDSSEYSLKACEYALSLAQRDGAKLFLQHPVQPLTFTCPCYAFPDPINEVFRNLETSAGQGRRESGHFTRDLWPGRF
jgi:Universal stress protein family